MTEELISHGFYKHPPGAPCKLCAKKDLKAASVTQKHESETLDTPSESAVPEVQNETPQVGQENASQNKPTHTPQPVMYTEAQVELILLELERAVTKKIFTTLSELLDKKQADLAAPVITRFDLNTLLESYGYETDPQSPGGE